MDIQSFFMTLLNVVCEMAPYLLLGFFIAGVLHVFVPQNFYANYLSRNNKLSVVWAALLGVPLPLCSCGVIPTAIGLRNEKASKGAIASFLIATPQTGIDSILATFSLMGLGFAIIRPTAALITGVCGGLLVNRLVREDDVKEDVSTSCQIESGNRIWRVLKYAYYDMLRDIGLMLVILVIAVPMYICSTGSIPVAAALMMKGLSPGAALVMLMAGPAVNLASILVVHKSMGRRFTSIYLMTIVGFAVLFGLLLNATGILNSQLSIVNSHAAFCMSTSASPSPLALPSSVTTLPSSSELGWLSLFRPFKIVCATVLTLLTIFALMMKFFSKFTSKPLDPDVTVYRVEDMHCSHCEAAVVRAVEDLPGVEKAQASASANTLTIKGTATEEAIRTAVEGIGYTFKGRK